MDLSELRRFARSILLAVIEHETATAVLSGLRNSKFWGRDLREEAMRRLSDLRGYDWCGIYRLEKENLILDAFIGEPTDHTEIPVGKGVCGTAVAQNANQVVQDVRNLDNYLSCSIKTRSEIVVLIRDTETGRILGQIDADGHEVSSFDASDEAFLDEMARILAERWNPLGRITG